MPPPTRWRGWTAKSGEEFDAQIFFGAPLAALDGKDAAYTARITDMNQRILRSMIANHLFDDPPKIGTPDIARGEAAARAEAAAGTCCSRTTASCRWLKTAKRIAVIGGYANIGVMSGGGSSQVAPQIGPGAGHSHHRRRRRLAGDDAASRRAGEGDRGARGKRPRQLSTPAPIRLSPRRGPRTPMSSSSSPPNGPPKGWTCPTSICPARRMS